MLDPRFYKFAAYSFVMNATLINYETLLFTLVDWYIYPKLLVFLRLGAFLTFSTEILYKPVY